MPHAVEAADFILTAAEILDQARQRHLFLFEGAAPSVTPFSY